MNWLDTETKGILQKEIEPKLAPPKAAEFGLVLLQKGADYQRLIRAICRTNECSEVEAVTLARSPVPVTVNPGLTQAEAIFGQFELICCDSISAFIRSEVLLGQDKHSYLQSLFQKVLESPEFRLTKAEVREVPATESGQKFLYQFLGIPSLGAERPATRVSVWAPFKKARIMKHWATRIGAHVECETLPDSRDDGDVI
jgi:hypothetical protein